MYQQSVITNLIFLIKWLRKLKLKLQHLTEKNLKFLDQGFMQKLKHLVTKTLKTILNHTLDKVNKMAQSIKKRIKGTKPVNKKTQLKFQKRMKSNLEVLKNLSKLN